MSSLDPITPTEATLPNDRSDWKAHENYPSQALLLGSHENFRRVSAHLVREASTSHEADPAAAPRIDLLYLFDRWKRAMANHEAYEEGKLYPYLRARYGVDHTPLETQHRELGEVEIAVRAAFDLGDRQRVVASLRRHDSLLVVHLAEEEQTVIPYLLAMSPDEFRHYYSGQIQTLLRELSGGREAR